VGHEDLLPPRRLNATMGTDYDAFIRAAEAHK
jgi:hypothetical protein